MTVPWLAVRVFFVFGVIFTLAWPQRRDVQAGFKIPFAIFLLEASGREKGPTSPGQTTLRLAEMHAQSTINVERADIRGTGD